MIVLRQGKKKKDRGVQKSKKETLKEKKQY
jgi:hypothetical protein